MPLTAVFRLSTVYVSMQILPNATIPHSGARIPSKNQAHNDSAQLETNLMPTTSFHPTAIARRSLPKHGLGCER